MQAQLFGSEAVPIKRKPGRPRKHPLPPPNDGVTPASGVLLWPPAAAAGPPPLPKKRGRPRKHPLPEPTEDPLEEAAAAAGAGAASIADGAAKRPRGRPAGEAATCGRCVCEEIDALRCCGRCCRRGLHLTIPPSPLYAGAAALESLAADEDSYLYDEVREPLATNDDWWVGGLVD